MCVPGTLRVLLHFVHDATTEGGRIIHTSPNSDEEGFEPRYFLIPKCVLYTIFLSALLAHEILVKTANFQAFLLRYSGSVGLAQIPGIFTFIKILM